MRLPRSQKLNRPVIVPPTLLLTLLALLLCSCGLLGQRGGDLTADQTEVDVRSDQPITTASSSADGATPDTPLSPSGSQFCGATNRNNFDIRFAPGESSHTTSGRVSADETDLYWIQVGDGQIISLTLQSPKDNAVAGIKAPDQSVVPGRFTEQTVAPTQAGTYFICVSPGEGDVSYDLRVSVIDDNTTTKVDASWCGDSVNDRGEIRFQPGAFSGQVQDGVVRGERDLYSVRAAAGQAVDIRLSSLEDNAVLSLRSPSGDILIDEVSDIRLPLPKSGIYQFCIGSIRGNASYTLNLTVE